MYRIGQWLRALVALAVIVLLVAGIPWFLTTFIGNPMPAGGLDAITLGGTDVLLGAIAVVGWLAWLQMVIALVAETVGMVRSVRITGRLPTFGGQREIAHRLVGWIAIAVIGGTSTASAASAATAPSHSSTGPIADGSRTVATAPQRAGDTSQARDVHGSLVSVGIGDTLWGLAQRHLGDGERWSEIADLNQGRTMDDGAVFHSVDFLEPGWQLRMPTDATGLDGSDRAEHVSRRPSASPQVRVERGDTLSSIAARHLGSPDRWPELVQLNRGRPQPTGGVLQHPDALQPGWVLELPSSSQDTSINPITDISYAHRDGNRGSAEHHARHQQSPSGGADQGGRLTPQRESTHKDVEVPDATLGAGTEAGGSASTASQPHGAEANPAGAEAAGSDDHDEDETAESRPWLAPVGIGAVLAAGLVGFVAGRRSTQQRHRGRGERISMPDEQAAAVEVAIRAVADPIAVTDIDLALRKLAQQCDQNQAGLPRIRMARLNGYQFELHLAEPNGPVLAPFEASDDMLWTIERDTIAALRPEANDLSEAYQAPYPALVSLGAAPDGRGHVMVDLEEASALGVCGDPQLTREMLAALVLELAMSRWADDLRLTVVGGFADLADELDTGRIVHCDIDRVLGQLRGRIADDTAALEDAGFDDVAQARIDPDSEDLWAPHIIMVLGDVDAAQRAELAELVEQTPRAAYAVVTENDHLTDWTVQIAGRDPHGGGLDAILEPDGLVLSVQHVTAEVYRAALEFAAASTEPPASADERAEIGIDELEMIASVGDGDTDAVDAIPVVGPGEGTDAVAASDSSDAAGEENLPDPVPDSRRAPAPMVRVLGPPEVEGARGTVRSSQRNKLVDVAAYLVLNPGRGPGDWSEALDVTNPDKSPAARKNYRTTRMSYLRTWLGENDAGEQYLPKLSPDAGYRLHDDVGCDWLQFQNLVGDDISAARTSDLRAALGLVRGRPFGAYSEGMFAWSGPMTEVMLATIIDTVEEYSRRRLLENEWGMAEWALSIGLSCAPERERLHRMRIRVAYASGDGQRTQEAIARLLAIRDSFDGELEDESMAMLREIRQRPARRDVAKSSS